MKQPLYCYSLRFVEFHEFWFLYESLAGCSDSCFSSQLILTFRLSLDKSVLVVSSLAWSLLENEKKYCDQLLWLLWFRLKWAFGCYWKALIFWKENKKTSMVVDLEIPSRYALLKTARGVSNFLATMALICFIVFLRDSHAYAHCLWSAGSSDSATFS